MPLDPSNLQFNIVSWNVRGISRNDLDDFCRILEGECQWDLLLLQEFAFTRDEFRDTLDGHLVFAHPEHPHLSPNIEME